MQENLFKRELLLIENDFFQSKLYHDALSANNFEVSLVKSAIDGFQRIKAGVKDYSLVVINVDMGQPSFIAKVLQKIRDERPMLPMIGLSIYEQENKKNVADLLNRFLTKPFSIDTLVQCVVVCVEDGSEDSYCRRAQA